MGLEQTWRWFGPNDPITLKEIKQTGATGIVTALHQIPVGHIWPVGEIEKRKSLIEKEGLFWSVVESVPVHEDIKKQKGDFRLYIENYKQTIRNLALCGIDTVCYNFMPVLDWSRTNLKVKFKDDAITTKFDADIFAAFDLFILKRSGAEANYSDEQIKRAQSQLDKMDENAKNNLLQTILLGLPGSLEAYTIEGFKKALAEYRDISEDQLRDNLLHFIREIVPVAEEAGVLMAIHPDDPPWSLLGLPRVVGNQNDISQIINVVDSPSNGLTLCTGSFGAGYHNDLVELTRRFAHRISFIHLRNLTRNEDGDFMEAYHMEGDIDLYSVMKILLLEQKRRKEDGRKDTRMPMRPDHGHLMSAEQDKKGIYPGYSLMGRLRGLSELRGMEIGIIRSLNI
ncbi:MAG: mannonate dehydratase [Calditrichaceae bacterium]|nr:mannonate dehydratase [Calditrichaceae bacterium]